jgi:hypothetical protein
MQLYLTVSYNFSLKINSYIKVVIASMKWAWSLCRKRHVLFLWFQPGTQEDNSLPQKEKI